ncbi:MAG TPA: VanZ family protein [Dehalococcoidia bacterium]|nr:VanZ family protein [Dehalococcoidia bacterium]
MRVPLIFPLLAWAALIFIVSSFSNPPESLGQEWPSYLAHVVEFGILGWFATAFTLQAFGSHPQPAILLLTLAGCVIYGASDEFHQSFVPGRDADLFDLLLDVVGSTVGIVAVAVSAGRARGRREESAGGG